MHKTAFSLVLGMQILAGCGSKPESPSAPVSGSASIKRYSMHGKVLSVDPGDKSVKIDAEEIPGWMSKMTMDYPVKDSAGFAKLAVDKNIEATVFVDGDNFWIGEIKDAPPAAEQKK